MNAYQNLKKIFSQLSQLNHVQHMMIWDEAVMMPEGAGESRAHAMATLGGMIQKILMSKKNKNLLERAKQEEIPLAWDQANLLWMEKKYNAASCIPAALAEKLTKETLICQQAWRKLRAQNNWADFLPYFERVFKCVKEVARRRGDALQLDPYDALLDEYAPGFNQHSIDAIFSGLKNTMPDLVKQIIQKQSHRQVTEPVGPFAIEKQQQIGLQIMRALQFDFQHGRLDVSHHPFCGGTPDDVRITTRYNEAEFFSALMGVCHETGHGLYEQGLPREWIDQPVGQPNSMAMHESQSLLIEMQVCCSLPFCEFLLPHIVKTFGEQPAFSAENLYRLTTQVTPGLIRVDADEATYPLHVILRYEIEKKLLNGDLSLKELPAYWNELMLQYLGLSTLENDKNGVMQDVHWPSGAFGYFPAYTLGRLIAAQFFASFIQSAPSFFENVRQGNFQSLVNWLHQHIYSAASSLSTEDLLMKVTGKALDATYFINHIKQRYLVD
jgi:carboxypeptidase Taq